jgi:hypothetical protein
LWIDAKTKNGGKLRKKAERITWNTKRDAKQAERTLVAKHNVQRNEVKDDRKREVEGVIE